MVLVWTLLSSAALTGGFQDGPNVPSALTFPDVGGTVMSFTANASTCTYSNATGGAWETHAVPRVDDGGNAICLASLAEPTGTSAFYEVPYVFLMGLNANVSSACPELAYTYVLINGTCDSVAAAWSRLDVNATWADPTQGGTRRVGFTTVIGAGGADRGLALLGGRDLDTGVPLADV